MYLGSAYILVSSPALIAPQLVQLVHRCTVFLCSKVKCDSSSSSWISLYLVISENFVIALPNLFFWGGGAICRVIYTL